MIWEARQSDFLNVGVCAIKLVLHLSHITPHASQEGPRGMQESKHGQGQ